MKVDEKPDAPPSPEELTAAGELREALADPARRHEDADFARAVALAHAPRDIAESAHRAIVARAMDRAAASGGRRVVALATTAGLALAAAFALVLTTRSSDSVSVAPPMVPSRSTQALFSEPFSRAGGECDRIDRIASARAEDLRDNQFAAWGVR